MFLEYSRKLTLHFSGGIKYSILFGNQLLNDELYTYDVIIDTTSNGMGEKFITHPTSGIINVNEKPIWKKYFLKLILKEVNLDYLMKLI